MAIRKTAAQKAAAEALEQQAEDAEILEYQEPEFMPEDVAVANLLAELGDNEAKVRVYRQGKGGFRDLTLIDEVSVSEFNPIMLKHPPYNGGTFRIHAQTPNGGMKINRELKVEPAPVQTQPAATSAPQGISAAELGAILAENNRQLLAGIVAAKPAADPMALVKDVMGMVTPLMVARPVPSGGSMAETLQLLATAKTLFAGDGAKIPEGAGMGEIALSKGLDVFLEAMKARGGNGALPAQPSSQVVESLPAPAVSGAPDLSQLTAEEQEDMLALQLAMMAAVRAAANKESAKDFAESKYDLIPEGVLIDICTAPDWWDKICAGFPAVTPHKEWFELVRLQLIQMATEDGILTPPAETVITPTGKGEANVGASNGAIDSGTPGGSATT